MYLHGAVAFEKVLTRLCPEISTRNYPHADLLVPLLA